MYNINTKMLADYKKKGEQCNSNVRIRKGEKVFIGCREYRLIRVLEL